MPDGALADGGVQVCLPALHWSKLWVPAREPEGVLHRSSALPMPWNQMMKHLSIYRLPAILCLLVLSGCMSATSSRSLESAEPVGSPPVPALSPIPTFTPSPTAGLRPRDGGQPTTAATLVPAAAEAEACPATGPSPSLHCDKEVLLAVRDWLRGEHRELLRSWHPDNSIYNFQGVVVTSGADSPRVVGLQWIGWWADPKLRLAGSLPPALGRLTQLEVLDLAGNELTGPIPEDLGQLGQLRELYLNANKLTGPIPAALGQLAQLQYLRLNNNQLTGSIPLELGQDTQLRELRLGQNRLTGPIPPWLGQLTHLTMLDLGHNELTGPIPAQLGQLGELQELYLHANEVTGPIPVQLGQPSRLRWLNLSHNRLAGPIPTELGQLAALRALYLHANEVTGPIPAELGQRAARHELFLHLHADEVTENQQGWSEPCPAVGPSPNLRCDKEVLLAVRDRLRGKNQAMLRTWHPDNHIVNFQGVVVRSGDGVAEVAGLAVIGWWSDPEFRLVGSLPPELSRLPELAFIVLRENGLRGSIPPEWGQLTHLEVLDLVGNELTGTVPPALGRLAHLERLDLGGNQLTGPIPAELGTLRNLQELNLSRNRLWGFIPAELGQLRNLQKLYLHANELTGPIPAELGQPWWIQDLRVEMNRLTGPIPPALGHLLVLDGNRQPAPISSVAEPCPETGPSPSLRCDKEVLLAVRDRLRNERLDLLQTWQPDNSIEAFEGVSLGDDPRRVIGLEIVGELPTSSPSLYMGAVPWQLSRLPQLERLVLRGNGLFGTIPPELGQLPRLRKLDLSGNNLRETIPAELGQLSALRELHLQDNILWGSIPPELGRLTQLQVLDLGNGHKYHTTSGLTGPIPPELGQLTQLQVLKLDGNSLTGCIPPALVPACECPGRSRCE